MGRYLDIIRRAKAHDINDINDISPASPSSVVNVVYIVPHGPFAEAFAALEARCPDRVDDPRRWHQAVADGRRFLAQWAEQAEALGWTADDLFGLDPVAPLARYDRMGLVWLLRGRPVVALTGTSATIRTGTGGTLTHRRTAIGGDGP